MTMTIADLRVNVRADVQQAKADIQSVGQQAQATAAQIDALARSLSQTRGGGGTGAVEGWRQLIQADPSKWTAMLAAMPAGPQAATRAVDQLTTSTGSAARAARDMSDGFRLSESSVVRFGAGLLGIGLGISLVAGAARLIHSELVGSVDAARQLELAGRAAAAGYGVGTAAGVGAAGRVFALDPTTRGTQTQYVEAVAGMRSLTTAYGLSLQQVQQLVTASGQLARIQGVDLPTAARALDAVMRGDTSAAQGLAVTLTDTAGRLRGVGATYEQLITISGRTRAEQVLLAATLQSVRTQQDNARGTTDSLAAAYDRLAKNAALARQAAGQQLAGPAEVVVGGLADLLNPPGPTAERAAMRRAGIVGMLSGGRGQLESGQILSAVETQRRLTPTALPEGFATEAVGAEILQRQASTTAIQAEVTAHERLRVAMDFSVQSLGRISQISGQFGTLLGAARGPYFPQVLGSATTIGVATAAQDQLALMAQRIAQGQGDRMRQQLALGVTAAQDIGPNAVARALQQLNEYDQRVAARTAQAQAQHNLALADLATAQTQAGLTEISLRQRDREINMQRATIDLRRLDVQLQQTALATTMQVTQARLTALPAEQAVSAAQYQQTLAQAVARQRMARLLQGQDVSGLPTFDELIRQNIQGAFAAAEAGPAAVRAQRAVELAQQRQTAAQLREQLVAGGLQGAQLAVDLANLGDLPEQTALLVTLNQNARDQLVAQQAERDAVLELVRIASQQPIAGAGVTRTVSVNFTGPVSVRNDQDVVDIANQAAELMAQAFAGSGNLDVPAPLTLAGARRPY